MRTESGGDFSNHNNLIQLERLHLKAFIEKAKSFLNQILDATAPLFKLQWDRVTRVNRKSTVTKNIWI